MRVDPGFLPEVLGTFDRAGFVPDLVVSSEVAVTLAVQGSGDLDDVARSLAPRGTMEVFAERAVVCVVGSGLAHDGALRARVLACLAGCEAEVVGLGASGWSASAVLPAGRLAQAVRDVHRKFFEEEAVA
jgi:aspartokinase